MALFQNSILNKYLATLDSNLIDKSYQDFCLYFHDAVRQKNILSSKEEQFQEGFLKALFADILGYTLNPDPGYNLITEKKDTKGSKKADAAILQDDDVVAVVELKDHKTPDLDKVERQAFGYKNQHKKATYVVISNFQKLRFYIDNAVDYIEWDLFKLTREEFSQLWLCLGYDCLMRGLPKTIKNESVSNEEQITNKLYKDYIAFKRELFGDILKRNTTEEGEHSTAEWKVLLFKKTQKLLDRMLFIFFAEDCGLLPPNSIKAIIEQWRMFIENDEDIRLYSRIKKYFGYMNTGYQGKKYEVFAYNGGLFKPDEVLDSLEIDDEVLALHTLRLSEYDFASDVDVNILGHIFENSLNEIEEVTAQLENGEAPAVSKRKKDGVFYTPQYITKYIVENTVGRLCSEKKSEFGIDELEYYSDEKRSKNDKKRMMDALTAYREWLLQITICDPACGSGAFLNAALRFLIDEHRRLDEMEANVTGSTIVFPGIENSILENNLFGVDINEESVEIARLALWLRTAKPHRKLSSLNNNIKCGNSLISDPAVAGDKAFNWEEEFPQVFAKGGFDVVIGNPPYVRIQGIKSFQEAESLYYEQNYDSAIKRYDLYVLFMERAMSIIKDNGVASYILPHNFLIADLGAGIRNLFTKNKKLEGLLHFGSHLVFAEALTYTCIVTMTGRENDHVKYASADPLQINDLTIDYTPISYDSLSCDKWNLTDGCTQKIFKRLSGFTTKISDYFSNVGRGIVTGYDDCFILKGEIKDDFFYGYSKALNDNIIIEKEIVRPILMGNSVHAYSNLKSNQYIIYPHIKNGNKTVVIEERTLESVYPKAYEYLLNFKDKLVEKKIKYKTNPVYWYSLHNCREISLFDSNKIITPYLANQGQMTFDDSGLFVTNDKCSVLVLKEEFLDKYLPFLALLNSKLFYFFITNTSSEMSGGYFVFSNMFINPFPVPMSLCENSDIGDLASSMLSLTADLQKLRARFHRRLKENLGIEKITNALEAFDGLTFEEFTKELKKQKVKLSLVQQDEWEDYFNINKEACQQKSSLIAQTDKEIDDIVYSLYGLEPDEIAIVENSGTK